MSGYGATVFPVTRKTCWPCGGKKHIDCEQKLADLDLFAGSCDCPCWDGTETSVYALAVTAEHWPVRAAISMRLNGRVTICYSRSAVRPDRRW